MGRKFDEMKLHLGIFILTILFGLYKVYSNEKLMTKYKKEPRVVIFLAALAAGSFWFVIIELFLYALDCIFNFNLY